MSQIPAAQEYQASRSQMRARFAPQERSVLETSALSHPAEPSEKSRATPAIAAVG